MGKGLYTEGFLNDATMIWSGRIKIKLANALQSIEEFPEIGSSNVPSSVKEEFGQGIRKFVVDKFDIIYEYDSENDVVMFYALIHQRMAE